MNSDELAVSLRKARVVAGATIRDAAAALGVSERTLYAWEKGEAMPPLDKAMALATHYGISMGELVGDPETKSAWRELAEIRVRLEGLDEAVRAKGPVRPDEPT